MRLKTFTAPSMREAMALVRDALGPDAIIVSSHPGDKGKGVRVTAAVEQAAEPAPAPAAAAPDAGDTLDRLAESLTRHGTPAALAERLMAGATKAQARTADPIISLAASLDTAFAFAPLGTPAPSRRGGRPLMLVGPPGVGKTVTVAKLAARAVMARQSVVLVTSDTQRAGAVDQLAAFARVLNAELVQVANPAGLAKAVADAGERAVVIDSAGVNPFDPAEIAELAALAAAVHAEPVLLVAAGGDAAESAEIAEAFAAIGVGRMVATRVDLARRLGGILASATAGKLAFAEASVTPHIAEGLSPFNPVSLARLLLPWAAQAESVHQRKQAVAS